MSLTEAVEQNEFLLVLDLQAVVVHLVAERLRRQLLGTARLAGGRLRVGILGWGLGCSRGRGNWVIIFLKVKDKFSDYICMPF